MTATASDWLPHFRLLWNRITEFAETWQEARTQHTLPRFSFQAYLNNKMTTQPLIGWVIFDFSSETTKRNLPKVDRNEELKVFYQVCVFSADRINKMTTTASDWPILFLTIPLEPLNRVWWNLRKQDLNVLYHVYVYRADQKSKMAALASEWLYETFPTSSLQPLNEIWWNLTGSKNSTSSTKFVFFWRIGKPSGRHDPKLTETFSTIPLELLSGIWWNLTRSKNSISSINFVIIGLIEKQI